jgi:hypothetical protein
LYVWCPRLVDGTPVGVDIARPLKRRLHALAPDLTCRSVAMQTIDVRVSTTDERKFLLTRYT